MRENAMQPDAFFYTHRGGRCAEGELAGAFADYSPAGSDHPYWNEGAPQSMLIDEVETIWSAIDERDDWAPLMEKVDALRRMGKAHGEPPTPAASQR
jgi:hypothetical protein